MEAECKLILKSSNNDFVLSEGVNILGRGPFLKIHDKRCSRNQIELVATFPQTNDDYKAILIPRGLNKSFLKRVGYVTFDELERDKEYSLYIGDAISLLPPSVDSSLVYTFSKIQYIPEHRTTQKRRSLFDEDVQAKILAGEVPTSEIKIRDPPTEPIVAQKSVPIQSNTPKSHKKRKLFDPKSPVNLETQIDQVKKNKITKPEELERDMIEDPRAFKLAKSSPIALKDGTQILVYSEPPQKKRKKDSIKSIIADSQEWEDFVLTPESKKKSKATSKKSKMSPPKKPKKKTPKKEIIKPEVHLSPMSSSQEDEMKTKQSEQGDPLSWFFQKGSAMQAFSMFQFRVAPSIEEIKTFTAKELKQILASQGKSTSGKKVDLVKRVAESLQISSN